MKRQEKTPKIGVALLAFNQGKYVDDAIESLKAQTFQDFEVYLIDDGSTDGFTPQKLESIEYEKITKKCLHKENLGSPYRRKQYYSILKNEYIINFCGDDILAPTYFEKTISLLEKNQKYGAVCSNLKFFKNKIKDTYAEKKYDENLMRFPDMLVSCNMLGSSMIRRKALSGLNFEWPLRSYFDWNIWCAMLEKGWQLGLVSEPLFYYRQLKKSLSHTDTQVDEKKFRNELLKRYPKVYKKYYKEIINKIYEQSAEIREGKNWLENQYEAKTKEIKRLNSVIKDLENENARLKEELNTSLIKKIYRKIAKNK
ncbi:glycosyltransferase [Candidatus Saccharibacteria bacterium]|nr:glycosyltransferase [Candidatus Saccharibacteria bacterium]